MISAFNRRRSVPQGGEKHFLYKKMRSSNLFFVQEDALTTFEVFFCTWRRIWSIFQIFEVIFQKISNSRNENYTLICGSMARSGGSRCVLRQSFACWSMSREHAIDAVHRGGNFFHTDLRQWESVWWVGDRFFTNTAVAIFYKSFEMPRFHFFTHTEKILTIWPYELS